MTPRKSVASTRLYTQVIKDERVSYFNASNLKLRSVGLVIVNNDARDESSRLSPLREQITNEDRYRSIHRRQMIIIIQLEPFDKML